MASRTSFVFAITLGAMASGGLCRRLAPRRLAPRTLPEIYIIKEPEGAATAAFTPSLTSLAPLNTSGRLTPLTLLTPLTPVTPVTLSTLRTPLSPEEEALNPRERIEYELRYLADAIENIPSPPRRKEPPLPPPATRLTHVAIVVKNLDDAPSAARGFLGTIDAVGTFLTGGVHQPWKTQSWLTHFAMILQFEGDSSKWVFERDCSGVQLYKCKELYDFDCFQWHKHLPYHVPKNLQDGMVCNVACCSNDWPGRNITLDIVRAFLKQQQDLDYHPFCKNCQHFVYDFYRYCLEHAWIKDMEFEHFGHMLQKEFVEHGGQHLGFRAHGSAASHMGVQPSQSRQPAAVAEVLPRGGTDFRLQERMWPKNVLCSSMKMWSPSHAGSGSWWRVIDLHADGTHFRLQETKWPNNVLCSSMKMWSPDSAGAGSWWKVIDFDGTCFRLQEKKHPYNVLCSSMTMWNPDHAGDDSWWHVA